MDVYDKNIYLNGTVISLTLTEKQHLDRIQTISNAVTLPPNYYVI